jgi:hypothetical protein
VRCNFQIDRSSLSNIRLRCGVTSDASCSTDPTRKQLFVGRRFSHSTELPRQITKFESEQILSFHWSPDGKNLGILRGHTDPDVVLLQESKPRSLR